MNYTEYREGPARAFFAERSTQTGDQKISFRPFTDAHYERHSLAVRHTDQHGEGGQLYSPDPFEKNLATGNYKMWEAIINTPVAGRAVHVAADPGFTRGINTYWKTQGYNAVRRVGPLGSAKLDRPAGPWVVDLRTYNNGYDLLDMAHTLAHIRGPIEIPDGKNSFGRNATVHRFYLALAEILVSELYGIPMFKQDKPAGQDIWPGIRIAVSLDIMNPRFYVPWMIDPPVPGSTTGVLGVCFHVESAPYSLKLPNTTYRPHERWSGHPSVVSIVGFEAIDVVSRYDIGFKSRYVKTRDAGAYVFTADDLLSPEYLSAHAELADASGFHWAEEVMRPLEWMKSEEYEKLRSGVPPLPCRLCFAPNAKSSVTPDKPRKRAVASPKKGTEWHDYMKTMKEGTKHAYRSTVLATPDPKAAKKADRARKREYNQQIKKERLRARAQKVLDKRRAGKHFTKREREFITDIQGSDSRIKVWSKIKQLAEQEK